MHLDPWRLPSLTALLPVSNAISSFMMTTTGITLSLMTLEAFRLIWRSWLLFPHEVAKDPAPLAGTFWDLSVLYMVREGKMGAKCGPQRR